MPFRLGDARVTNRSRGTLFNTTTQPAITQPRTANIANALSRRLGSNLNVSSAQDQLLNRILLGRLGQRSAVSAARGAIAGSTVGVPGVVPTPAPLQIPDLSPPTRATPQVSTPRVNVPTTSPAPATPAAAPPAAPPAGPDGTPAVEIPTPAPPVGSSPPYFPPTPPRAPSEPIPVGPVTTQDDFPAGFTTPPTTVDPNVRAALEFLGDQQARDPNFTVGAPFTPPPTPTTAPTTNPRQVDGPGTTQSRPVNVPALPRFPLINDLYNIYPNLPFATVERVVREEGGDLRTANDRLARGDY